MPDYSLPQRPSSHVIDSRAKTLLRAALPPQWILRDQTENDYGIDFHLEFTDQNNQVIGWIAGIQLKGTASGSREKPEESPVVEIKRRTLNLWKVYETPVFIVMIDVDTERVYFKSIELEKRHDPARFIIGRTESLSLRFTEADFTDVKKLDVHYQFAKNLRMMDWALPSIMATHKTFISLFDRYQRNGHLPVDGEGTYDPENFAAHEQERRIRNVYSDMRELCPLIGFAWGVPSIEATIQDHDWYDGGSEMHECHFTMILQQLDVKFQEIFETVKIIVTSFNKYWKLRNPEFATYALEDHPLFSKLSHEQRKPYLKF